MRAFIAVALAWLLAVAGPSSAQMTLTGAGGTKVASAAAFVGPVDAVASPLGCWSLRACTSALRGQKVVNACDNQTLTCADLVTDATTGNLVPQTVGTVTCPGAGCTAAILYFQTGSLTCSSNCNLTDGGIAANRPTLASSCAFGKSACLQFTGSEFLTSSNSTTTNAQPNTLSVVAIRTGSFTSQGGIVAVTSNFILDWQSAANTIDIFAGSDFLVTQTDNAWHAMQAIYNGASSMANVDGTVTSGGNPGANGVITGGPIDIGADIFGQHSTQSIAEVLLYPIGFTTGNATTMCHNQFSYWGTSTSC